MKSKTTIGARGLVIFAAVLVLTMAFWATPLLLPCGE